MTQELLPQLQTGHGRVINATGPSPDKLNFDDLMAKKKYNPFMQFRATNAANLMLAFEFARRLKKSMVTYNAFHPGTLQSNLMKQMPLIVKLITFPFGRTPDKAANAHKSLALDEQFTDKTGLFYHFTNPIYTPKNSLNQNTQNQLWEILKQLTN